MLAWVDFLDFRESLLSPYINKFLVIGHCFRVRMLLLKFRSVLFILPLPSSIWHYLISKSGSALSQVQNKKKTFRFSNIIYYYAGKIFIHIHYIPPYIAAFQTKKGRKTSKVHCFSIWLKMNMSESVRVWVFFKNECMWLWRHLEDIR